VQNGFRPIQSGANEEPGREVKRRICLDGDLRIVTLMYPAATAGAKELALIYASDRQRAGSRNGSSSPDWKSLGMS
jgi:hypothetical protein